MCSHFVRRFALWSKRSSAGTTDETLRMNTTLSTGAATSLSQEKSEPDFVRITHAHAYTYRVPERSTSTVRPINVVVVVKAETADGRQVEGYGEGQPRSWRTGDDAGDYWKFVSEAAEMLPGQTIDLSDADAAIKAVQSTMSTFKDLARRRTEDAKVKRPFRGSMLGFEVALLDLVAKARQVTLAKLLGQQREAAPLYAGAVSPKTSPAKLRSTLKKESETHEMVRLTGSEDIQENVGLLKTATSINLELGIADKPLWLDLNGVFNRRDASRLVKEIAELAASGDISSEVILEQPVPVLYGDHLGTLQKDADSIIEKSGRVGIVVRVQGDESVSDAKSVARLKKVGGVRGINVRPAQAGGLLASLDLARAFVKEDPEGRVFLTRMVGGSRLTASALRHLALALPRIDGAVVASVVESSMKMTRLIPTAEEAAAAGEEQVPQTPSTYPAPATSSLRIIQHTEDDEPETDLPDDRDEGVKRTFDDAPDDDTRRDDATDDNAEQRDAFDNIRRFRVRDVPGHGVEIRYAGLISDIRDAIAYPVPPAATYQGIPVTKYNDVDDLHPLGPNGSKGHLLEREALALGLNTTRYSKGAFTVTDGEHEPIPFKWSRNPLSSAAALALCTHKEATRMQLQQAGVPVPQGRTFARGDYATAKEFVARIGYPVVVKPTMGVRGIGVVAGIQDEEQLDAAFALMSGSKLGGQDFIVEKHVHGADYRIVVIGDEVIAAIQREPSSVFGDGKSTIAELLINKNIARRRNPHLWARPAKFDDAARHELEKVGRDLDTVLPEGERQLLANTCSLSQGGDSIDVLDEMHPSIKAASVAAVKAMPGLYFCGVDFLLEDHTKPLDEQDAGICELNAHAAIGNCEYPMFGRGRPVAKTMMQVTVEHFGLKAKKERATDVALHLTIRGRVTGVGFRKWLQKRAYISGVSGWIRNVNRRTVEVVLFGPTDPTTAVAAATILGPPRAVATAYEAKQIPFPQDVEGFEIREDAPQGTRVEAVDAT